MFLLSVIY